MDALTLAGLLLVVAPVLGLLPVGYPPLLGIWSATRDDHIRTVAAHRRAWGVLNAGFVFATIGTTAGLVALTLGRAADPAVAAVLGTLALAYAIAGTLWCAMLAIRARTTPALADLGAPGAAPTDAETLLGAATGGLFAAFILVTGVVLVLLGVVLAVSGTVALPVAVVAVLIGAVALGSQVVTGDTVPAILYLATLLIGIALLAGWT